MSIDILTLALIRRYVDEHSGSSWHHGETPPMNEIGQDGDYYLHTASGDLYTKNGNWQAVVNLEGSSGGVGFGNLDGGHPDSVYANLRVDGGDV